jgi:DNA primase
LIQSGRDIHRKLPEWKLAVLLFQERSIVNLFKEVKVAVTARQVAERYGLKVNRAGMACCPFHDDRNPSMKLDDRFYCFGCGATGDAVDLTARLLDLTSKEAALQLASDFGIVPLEDGRKSKVVEDKMPTTKKKKTDPIVNWVDRAIRIMTEYLWKK